MKFFSSALVASLFAVCALGQGVRIGAPKNGTTITAGSQITIEVDRPNTLTSSKEVAIVIALASCPNGTCPDPTFTLENVLYEGPFNPQYTSGTSDGLPPHQFFNATVPATLPKGQALLSVVHLALAGSGPFPLYQIVTGSLNVE